MYFSMWTYPKEKVLGVKILGKQIKRAWTLCHMVVADSFVQSSRLFSDAGSCDFRRSQ